MIQGLFLGSKCQRKDHLLLLCWATEESWAEESWAAEESAESLEKAVGPSVAPKPAVVLGLQEGRVGAGKNMRPGSAVEGLANMSRNQE